MNLYMSYRGANNATRRMTNTKMVPIVPLSIVTLPSVHVTTVHLSTVPLSNIPLSHRSFFPVPKIPLSHCALSPWPALPVPRSQCPIAPLSHGPLSDCPLLYGLVVSLFPCGGGGRKRLRPEQWQPLIKAEMYVSFSSSFLCTSADLEPSTP